MIILQHDLRQRMIPTLDRQELNELLQHLVKKGEVRRTSGRSDLRPANIDAAVGTICPEEEAYMHWFVVKERAWYHISE
jgi:hypothetical protein